MSNCINNLVNFPYKTINKTILITNTMKGEPFYML